MKDEEMADKHAENYVMREDVITENNRVPFDNGYGFQTVSFENEVKKGYKYGFLAGLKAGRPQWHDAKEFPPKDKNAPNTSIYVLDQYGQKVFYSYFYKVWKSERDFETKVTHWCEIPTYDKE